MNNPTMQPVQGPGPGPAPSVQFLRFTSTPVRYYGSALCLKAFEGLYRGSTQKTRQPKKPAKPTVEMVTGAASAMLLAPAIAGNDQPGHRHGATIGSVVEAEWRIPNVDQIGADPVEAEPCSACPCREHVYRVPCVCELYGLVGGD